MSDKEEKRSSEDKRSSSIKTIETEYSIPQNLKENPPENPIQNKTLEPVEVKPFVQQSPQIQMESKFDIQIVLERTCFCF